MASKMALGTKAVRPMVQGVRAPQRAPQTARMVAMDASIQFIKGIDESCIPDVRLTRSRDGASGTATFVFEQPSVFEAGNDLGDITGLYMVDSEGEIATVEVQAKFINGKPSSIEARHIMRSPMEWERFMRFMERYAEDQGLGFNKAK
ncbi:unnamed protein product [Pedinophyceae sp. YPF-701]|nr:unnamed protein product [Pedinophyceae sp. YPF-701]